jgi:hypothetical protein
VTRRVFVLLGWDTSTSAPTLPVGVLGVDPDGTTAVEWIPHVYDAADGWRDRLADTASVGAVVDDWSNRAGVVDLLEVAPPAAPDLATAIACIVDDVLAAASGVA